MCIITLCLSKLTITKGIIFNLDFYNVLILSVLINCMYNLTIQNSFMLSLNYHSAITYSRVNEK